MHFGGRVFDILDVKNGAALLLSRYIITQRPYHDAYKEITWADCALRNYLNADFYQGFSAQDRQRIIPTVNSNPANHWYGTPGGEDTKDWVFLLSLEEATCGLLGDSSAKLYSPGKNQRYWFERKDENNARRTARLAGEDGAIWWWWLRSPGRVGVKAVYVHGDGNIGIQGNNILKGNIADGRCTGGVRPALWVQL